MLSWTKNCIVAILSVFRRRPTSPACMAMEFEFGSYIAKMQHANANANADADARRKTQAAFYIYIYIYKQEFPNNRRIIILNFPSPLQTTLNYYTS